MNAWIASLAAIGQGRSKIAILHVLFPVVLQSLAIYSVYRALRWSRTKRHGTNQSALRSPDTEPAQRKEPNKDREPGGMFDLEYVFLGVTDNASHTGVPIYRKR